MCEGIAKFCHPCIDGCVLGHGRDCFNLAQIRRTKDTEQVSVCEFMMGECSCLLRPTIDGILLKRSQYIGELKIKLVIGDECLKVSRIQPTTRSSVGGTGVYGETQEGAIRISLGLALLTPESPPERRFLITASTVPSTCVTSAI
jgi:hypothetical protein